MNTQMLSLACNFYDFIFWYEKKSWHKSVTGQFSCSGHDINEARIKVWSSQVGSCVTFCTATEYTYSTSWTPEKCLIVVTKRSEKESAAEFVRVDRYHYWKYSLRSSYRTGYYYNS